MGLIDETYWIERALTYVCRQLLRLVDIELRRFAQALQAWINELLLRRLPPDWRGRLHAYLDAWDAEGFGVAPEHRQVLENWLGAWAEAQGFAPHATAEVPYAGVDASGSLSSSNSFGAMEAYFHQSGLFAEYIYEISQPGAFGMPTGPRIVKVEQRLGLGAWYDEAVTSGQYQPGFLTRVAVETARAFFPDSEPATISTYEDGTVEILLSGGPTSGAMAQQALAIAGVGVAAKQGKVLKEVVDSVADTAFQQATGAPVGPSVLKSGGKQRAAAQPPATSKPREPRANRRNKNGGQQPTDSASDQNWDETHPLVEGTTDRPRSRAHTLLQESIADEMQMSGYYVRVSKRQSLSKFSGVQVRPDIQPDNMGLTRDGKIDMFEILSPSQSETTLVDKLEKAMRQLPPEMRGGFTVIDPKDASQ